MAAKLLQSVTARLVPLVDAGILGPSLSKIRSEACGPSLAVPIWLGSDNDASGDEVVPPCRTRQEKGRRGDDAEAAKRRPLSDARPGPSHAAQRQPTALPHLAPSDVPVRNQCKGPGRKGVAPRASRLTAQSVGLEKRSGRRESS